ncbi:centromere protein T isoform X2 [Clupea harengus]|uniref:Centromere protein T isoform X2 n=1 Tax=Clupea harengus TaxID=7950 RepID=A0A6P8FPY1_CLUHA|nr:centromere protein T isoform X2 [Clupea harengus]
MDSLEDVSARLILRNVLQTEEAKTPVNQRLTRSQAQSAKTNRMSTRKMGRASGGGTPLVALRHKLKQQLREGASSSSARRSKLKEASPKKPPLPLLDDPGATPRVLLRGIMQTQAEKPMVSNQPSAKKLKTSHGPATEEVKLPPTETSLYDDTQRDPEAQSELDLSNVTLEVMQPVTKGLSRKRDPPPMSVSCFERQLEHLTEEAEAEAEPDVLQDSSASNSSLSLTLKTPAILASSKRSQFQRKPTNLKLVTEEVFDEALQVRLQKYSEPSESLASRMEGDSSWQGFTLGLSDVTVPDLTTDIIMSNTALYPRPETADNVKELQANPSQKEEFKDLNQRTGIREVSSTHPEEMVPETQEEEFKDLNQRTGIREVSSTHPEEMVPETQEEEFKDLNQRTGIREVSSTHPEEMVPETQEEDEFVSRTASQTADMDYIEPVKGESEEITAPGSAEEIAAPGSAEEIIEPGSAEEIIEPGSAEEITAPGSAEEIIEDGSAEEIIEPGSAEDIIEDGSAEEIIEPGSAEEQLSEDGSAEEIIEPGSAEEQLSEDGSAEEQMTEDGSAEEQMTGVFPQDEEMETSQPLEQVVGCSAHPSEHGVRPAVSAQTQECHRMFEPGTEEDNAELESETGSQSDHALAPDSDHPLAPDSDHPLAPDSDHPLAPDSALPYMPSPRYDEEEEEDDEEEEDFQELGQQTPAFVKQRKEEQTILRSASPVLSTDPRPVAGKSKPRQGRRRAADPTLPKSYVQNMFKHFAKTQVSKDVYPVVNEILQKYFKRVTEDLEAFASHAKRRTIEKEDVELLMRRQGFLTDRSPVNVLIEKFLPMEYRKLLIPIATSGNKVIPKQ